MNDKLKHFIAGFIITGVAGLLFGLWVGVAAGVIAGAGKELYDLAGYGTPEWLDFIATVAGSGLAALLISLAVI